MGWNSRAQGRIGTLAVAALNSGNGLGTPRTLGSAADGHPAGNATLGGTLELRAPLGTAPGTYRAVLTITAVS